MHNATSDGQTLELDLGRNSEYDEVLGRSAVEQYPFCDGVSYLCGTESYRQVFAGDNE